MGFEVLQEGACKVLKSMKSSGKQRTRREGVEVIHIWHRVPSVGPTKGRSRLYIRQDSHQQRNLTSNKPEFQNSRNHILLKITENRSAAYVKILVELRDVITEKVALIIVFEAEYRSLKTGRGNN